jgi:lipoprotein-anchoring transpeptidase ErfK/SrfK
VPEFGFTESRDLLEADIAMKRIPILLAVAAGLAVCGATRAGAQSTGGQYAPPPAGSLSADLSGSRIPDFNSAAGAATSGVRVGSSQRNGPAATVQSVPQFAMLHAPAAAVLRPEPEVPIDPKYLPQTVDYQTEQPAGTIVIDTESRFLYLVEADGKARRYGVGVGKPGFEWAGTHKITRKAEWPEWRPPQEMIEREAKVGHYLPEYVDGGPHNPLGARALYLGSSLYRVHGTNQPWTIGKAVSSGCIRMRNEDVIELYDLVKVGGRVIVS